MSKSQNQLFIGRLPRACRERDLEDIFTRYGKMLRCDMKTGYGFVEYEDRRDAEDAIRGEDGSELMGSKIVVEWARGPKYDYRRDDYKRGDRDQRRSPPRRDRHFSDKRSRSRSRERDYEKSRRYSYEQDDGRGKRRSRSPDRDRRRSPDRDIDRRSRSRS